MPQRSHSGQALVVVLAFTTTLVGAFLLVFSLGQVVNDKLRLVNAADAAAFSAAQWEARSLNYQAYLNRAIVANEVAIAQLVSLRSWSGYLQRTTRNAAIVGNFVPPLAAATRALARGWQAVDSVIGRSLPPLESGLSRWNVDVLANAEALAHQQAVITASDLVASVAQANEPRAQVTEATRILEVRNATQWQNRFTARFRHGEHELDRFVDLLMSSRDGFSSSRSGDLLPGGSPVQVSRRGGTDLLGEYSWHGVDTLSAHIDLAFLDREIPIGWGAAEQRRLPVSQRGYFGGSPKKNPAASRRAQRELVPRQQYRGVPEIRDVVSPQRQDDRTLMYSVALQMPRNSIATADRLLGISGLESTAGEPISTAPDLADGALQALSTAEVYFRRPTAREDGRREYPSLFSPYWQSRLTGVSREDRSLTAPFRGLTVDPFAVLP
jgi:Putative Flp pilus-assembly TadE/G-like